MFQFETNKFIMIISLIVGFSLNASAASQCKNLFINKLSFRKISWIQIHDLLEATKYPKTRRWLEQEVILSLADGNKVNGRINTVPFDYKEPSLPVGMNYGFKMEFEFEIASVEQAQKVALEIHRRHSIWINEGKRLEKIGRHRIELPLPGDDQVMKFQVNGKKVRIWFDYPTEPSIGILISYEMAQALIFTGVEIDPDAVQAYRIKKFRIRENN